MAKLNISLENGTDKYLFKKIMRLWLPVASTLSESIIQHLPSPLKAQQYRTEMLYTGPMTDMVSYVRSPLIDSFQSSLSMLTCDAGGPFVMYIAKMIGAPNVFNRMFALGRVYSGTLSAGNKVNVLSPDYSPGDQSGSKQLIVHRIVCGMGRTYEIVSRAYAGKDYKIMHRI